MELFKGYVPTKGKQCTMKFKDKTAAELLTLREARKLDEFAGILAEDAILIDFDDEAQSETMFKIVNDKRLKCRVYQTTHGKHFLFKNTAVDKCRTKKPLACGFQKIDIKLGCRNSYSVLKFDGKERAILYDIENEEYQELPAFLRPLENCPDFSTMGEGDGRNQKLFNYILTLQSEGLEKEQIRETLEIINNYILPEPLPPRELETLSRDEAFQKPAFYKRNVFLFDKFAQYIATNNHIKAINGQLHIYEDGIYVNGSKPIQSAMIQLIPGLNRSKRSEVLDYLELIVEDVEFQDNSNLIAFRNGIYDISEDKLFGFSPDNYITNKIPWDYNPSAESELLEKTLDKIACHDSQIRDLLDEVIGYCFYRRNELRKSFILVGDKANGKSSYLDLINFMLGKKNVANLDLKDLGNQFSPSSLYGMLANIGDDIGDDFITGSTAAQFKKVVSGSIIRGEKKGKDEFFFEPYCKMIYSANDIPRIKDKSGAALDRMVMVPFDARFSPNDPDFDPYIKYKLRTRECMEALVMIGLKGLHRVLTKQRFTICDKVQRELEEYEENNNPILLFFQDVEREKIINNPTKDLYRKYNEFCLANNFSPLSNIEFSKLVKKNFDLEIVQKRINGEKCRIFKEI